MQLIPNDDGSERAGVLIAALFGPEALPADPEPQGAVCGGGGWYGDGGYSLDGGWNGDDSGMGMGFPIGSGGIGGGMGFTQYTFTGSANFPWDDYDTLAQLLHLADVGEIGLSVNFLGGGADFPGGQSGGGGDKKRDLLKAALQEKNLSKCLHKFFGPGTILTNSNLPSIDATQNLAGAAIGEVHPWEVPDSGRASVYIDRGSFAGLSANDPILVGTYLHEVANVLAIQRFTDIQPRAARSLMGPRGRYPTPAQSNSLDPDIGNQFENCIKP